jgi:hypothetical protein
MAAMDLADFRRLTRPWPAVAAAAVLLTAPAIAIAFGFGGGMHGAMHGGGARLGGAHPAPPPRAIDAPARAPFFNAPPARVRVGFHPRDDFRVHDRFGRGRFRDRRLWTLGGPWGWDGYWGDEAAYAGGAGGPVYVQRDEAQAEPPPPPCPELLTWQPRLGRATRQRLCDDVPDMRG